MPLPPAAPVATTSPAISAAPVPPAESHARDGPCGTRRAASSRWMRVHESGVHVAGADIAVEEATFASRGATLLRRCVRPAAGVSAQPVWATLVFVHGYGDHSGRYLHFLEWLARRGVACHAFDLRGQGQSTGRRGFVRRWEDYLEDLASFFALDALRAELNDGRPLFL